MAWAKVPCNGGRWEPFSAVDGDPSGTQHCGAYSVGYNQASVEINSSLVNTHRQQTRISGEATTATFLLISVSACSAIPGKHLAVCLQQEEETGWGWQLL